MSTSLINDWVLVMYLIETACSGGEQLGESCYQQLAQHSYLCTRGYGFSGVWEVFDSMSEGWLLLTVNRDEFSLQKGNWSP